MATFSSHVAAIGCSTSQAKQAAYPGIYLSDLATRSVEDTILITILGRVIPPQAVSVNPARLVLQVDIEHAWNEMRLDGGWSNEIPVQIFIS